MSRLVRCNKLRTKAYSITSWARASNEGGTVMPSLSGFEVYRQLKFGCLLDWKVTWLGHDTGFLLHVLQDLWTHVPRGKPLRVGVALMGLVPRELHQPDLFEKPREAKLVKAIDAVNEKFGKGALVYGDATPEHTSKIAFQRVPKVTEF